MEQIFLRNKYLAIIHKLVQMPAIQREMQAGVFNNTELQRFLLTNIVELLFAQNKFRLDKFAREFGIILSPAMAKTLPIYTGCFKDSPIGPYCPFRKDNGTFYDVGSGSAISNNGKVVEMHIMLYPLLLPHKEFLYQVCTPIVDFIGHVWNGASGLSFKDGLLPPYHPVLVIKLEYLFNGVKLERWLAYDKGKEGIGLIASQEYNAQALLGENAHHAKCVHSCVNIPPTTSLYDLLEFGISHSEPMSLKWYMEQYKDDPIKAVVKCSDNSCWPFVFDLVFEITGEKLDTGTLANRYDPGNNNYPRGVPFSTMQLYLADIKARKLANSIGKKL